MTDISEIQRQLGDLMDIDRECVQVAAIVCGTIVGVAALVVDGQLGYAMGTGLMSAASGVVGYLFGVGKEARANAEEV